MSEKQREAPAGFIVGTINEPGYCEACKAKLKVGNRAAMWNPTAELFCIECANTVGGGDDGDWVTHLAIPILVVAGLLVILALGLAQ